MSPALHVVMYHYVRDLPNTPFPRIKGMLITDFQQQLVALQDRYEMATLEVALDFLQGTYTPSRDLCLLTFDDGLKEHYTEVTPLLADQGIQGIFFPITSCLQDYRVVSVHMNHFLMATLDFAHYKRVFTQALRDIAPQYSAGEVDTSIAQRTYRWDTPEVACFKYVLNFVLDRDIRDQIVKLLFEEYIADEATFSQSLYLSWEEARQMQKAGMLIGGHSHQHKPLRILSPQESWWDLCTCYHLLTKHLEPQSLWPFSYPYGKKETFSSTTVKQLRQLGFACAFSTEVGPNFPGMEIFGIHRLDCKDAPKEEAIGPKLPI